MNIKEIKEMLQLMAEHGLTEIEIEKEGMKIKLKKGMGPKLAYDEGAERHPVVVPMPNAFDKGPAAALESNSLQEAPNVVIVKSPMVGTFYASPAPDQPSYATAGKRVSEGDVLCIVEAMKLMNEIKSEVSGTVVEVLVKNGQPVEFDQPLFKIQRG